jgi:hypothetical protein
MREVIMSKLDAVVGVQGNDEYNEGFNAGINFVKTVIDTNEFNNLFSDILLEKKAISADKLNQVILLALKEFNV